jgi:hypothetical protein
MTCISESLPEVRVRMLATSAEVSKKFGCRWNVYEGGERVCLIDLRPYVTIHVEGHPDFTFLGPG